MTKLENNVSGYDCYEEADFVLQFCETFCVDPSTVPTLDENGKILLQYMPDMVYNFLYRFNTYQDLLTNTTITGEVITPVQGDSGVVGDNEGLVNLRGVYFYNNGIWEQYVSYSSSGGGSGLIDHIEVEGIEQPNINKTVNITRQAIFASNNNISQFTNNGDGTSPYTTASEVSEALLNKQDKLTAGDNITIEDTVISAQVPIAAKEYPGTVYMWEDDNGVHIWNTDPQAIQETIEENDANGLTYIVTTMNYEIVSNLTGSTCNIPRE